MTFTKSDSDSLEAARALYNSEEVSGVLERQRGPASTTSSSPSTSPARASR
jgi:hypothetical protein